MYTDNNTILIRSTKGVSVIDISSIIRIEAVSNYSKLFLAGGTYILVSKVLKQIEEMLEGKGFARVHRSHLVNRACIRAFNFYQLKVLLHNEEDISISRRMGANIRKSMRAQRAAHISKQKELVAQQ